MLNVYVFFIIYYCLSPAERGNGEGREAEGKVGMKGKKGN